LSYIHQHFLLFSFVFFFIGFISSYCLFGVKSQSITENETESFFSKEKKKKPKINQDILIDNTTHVVSINTEGLEKKYEEIGNNKTKQENISSSIDKLKTLKK
jgi:hypothetical protein